MCPDVADKADSGTKRSVAVRELKVSINRRACFRSSGFAEQSSLLPPGVSWFVHRTQLPSGSGCARCLAQLLGFPNTHCMLFSKAFRKDLRESFYSLRSSPVDLLLADSSPCSRRFW